MTLCPKTSFVREKFARERAAAKKLAAEYFDRFPKDRYQTEVESWRLLAAEGTENPQPTPAPVPLKGAIGDSFRPDCIFLLNRLGVLENQGDASYRLPVFLGAPQETQPPRTPARPPCAGAHFFCGYRQNRQFRTNL